MPTKVEVGRRVRLARFRRDMTLKEVARKSGMSATHISEIERGKTSPTIGALQRIANALEERSAHFVEEHDVPDVVLTKKGERSECYASDDDGRVIRVEKLTGTSPWSTMVVLRKLSEPGEVFERTPRVGEIVVICVKGMVRITIGDESHVLRDGDTIQFPADIGYRAENIGESTSETIGIGSFATGRSW